MSLEETRKSLEFAANCYRLNQDVLLEAKRFGYKLNEIQITKAMLGKGVEESSKFCKNIRDTQLNGYLDAHLRDFIRKKKSSYDIEKLKTVIIAEQQFLKEIHNSLKFALNEYNNANRDLFMNLQASAIASEKPELINKIFDLAGKLIREHGASEMSVYRDLSFSGNAATVYQSLEETLAIKQQFRKPEILAEARLKAVSPEEALAAIQKEQNNLADLHGNIKYFTDNKELASKAELAWKQRENNAFNRLESVAKMSLETCTETKDTLLKKLQSTTDLKATYRALSKNIHEHKVKVLVLEDSTRMTNNLLIFASQKRKETSLTKVIGVIKQEQEFLTSLDGKLKYPKAHDTDLINSIKSASDNLRSGKFDKLAKFVSFLESNTKDHAPIISILKSNTDVTKTYNILLNQYHEKCINVMNKVVSTLDAGKSITLDNKKFDCSVKFLDYLSKNRNSEFFPHQELQKIQTKVVENRKELELSKSKGLELDL